MVSFILTFTNSLSFVISIYSTAFLYCALAQAEGHFKTKLKVPFMCWLVILNNFCWAEILDSWKSKISLNCSISGIKKQNKNPSTLIWLNSKQIEPFSRVSLIPPRIFSLYPQYSGFFISSQFNASPAPPVECSHAFFLLFTVPIHSFISPFLPFFVSPFSPWSLHIDGNIFQLCGFADF